MRWLPERSSDGTLRQTDIPASRAACRTPLPAANAILAFSTLALAMGGLPNLMDKLRAAA